MEPNKSSHLIKTRIIYKQTEKSTTKNILTLFTVFLCMLVAGGTIALASTIPVMEKSYKESLVDDVHVVEVVELISEIEPNERENYDVPTEPVRTIHQEESTPGVTIIDNYYVKEKVSTMNTYKSIKDRITEDRSNEIVDTQYYDEHNYKFVDGWTTTNVNLRQLASIESDVLDVYYQNKKISYASYDEFWAIVKLPNNEIGYIAKEYIGKEPLKYHEYDTVQEYQKSYMSYTALTSRSSKQYKLQTMAVTGNYGVRTVNGRYLVALGSYYTTRIGVYFDLILKNGTVIPCILGDAKADAHTDATHRYTKHDGSVAEFIIDKGAISHDVRQMGNLGYATKEWNSPIVKIRIYDKSVF